MIVLIHSSKTMKLVSSKAKLSTPELLPKAQQLAAYLKTLDAKALGKCMHLSPSLALKTTQLAQGWTAEPARQSRAIDSFIGDIYSGLQAQDFSAADHKAAQVSLRILSGLYGILRPQDGIYPYRLEMGYKLPKAEFKNLYKYWAEDIAKTLPRSGPIVNASAEEYTKAVLPYIDSTRVITPQFLTMDAASGETRFVVVHAKIARGAFARFIIKNGVKDSVDLIKFNDLGYRYDAKLSQPGSPAFVCKQFGGLGLSVRLNK